jgi:hypothetical protein
MSEIIDLGQRRKAKEDEGDYILACDCGCAMFRLYANGEVMCLNCDAGIEGLTVVISSVLEE